MDDEQLARDLAAVTLRLSTFSEASGASVTNEIDTTSSKAERVADEVIAQLRPALTRRLTDLEAQGRDPESVDAAAVMVSRMLSALPEPSAWDEILGPFYRTASFARVLGVSTRTVVRRKHRRTLLGLETEDHVLVYPAFQLDPNNRLWNGLPEILSCFHEVPVDDWTLAGWLVTSQDALDGYSVIDGLRNELDPSELITLARDAALRFSQ